MMLLQTAINAASSISEHPGAMRMQEMDPHGFTLSLVAVGVVFSALIILFLLYRLSGAIFTGKFRRKPKAGGTEDETAAAIALALSMYSGGEDDAAAIATALHLYLSEQTHDSEPGFITIRRELPSGWNDKSLILRKKPQLK